MLVNQEQPKVWNRNLVHSGDEQLLNNQFGHHFHGLWLINTSNMHANRHILSEAGWIDAAFRGEDLKGAALFLPERSPLMGAYMIFCMIFCIHWQLINLRTIFPRTLMSLMWITKPLLCPFISCWRGVLCNNSQVRLYLQLFLHIYISFKICILMYHQVTLCYEVGGNGKITKTSKNICCAPLLYQQHTEMEW